LAASLGTAPWISAMAGADSILAERSARASPALALPWVPGLQLYTLGLTPRDDLESVFHKVYDIGYRIVEFPAHYERPATELRRILDGVGLTCPSVHVSPSPAAGMWDVQTDLSKLANDLHALGAGYAVVPIPLLPDRITDVLHHPPAGGLDAAAVSRLFDSLHADDWKRTADLLNEKAAILARSGIRMAYHNHGVDFNPLPNSMTGYDIMLARTDAKLIDLELDVGWAVSAGRDIGALFKRIDNRLRLLHLKDTKRVATSSMDLASTDAGTGIVDWQQLASLVRRSSVKYMFVEQEPPFEHTAVDSARVDHAFLTTLFAGGGPSLRAKHGPS
jgi:sugar phosphate isomerase/epimerase